ncbi:MAG: 50S ribosomal protein L5 [Candidatus Parcubacteria bacterium]|nr:MAG: 50S ribosomal protein L5 [Candidatus Parcubacteria bacterium]
MIDLKKSYPLKGIIQIGIAKMVANSPDNQQKIIEDAMYVLAMITGQKPVVVKAKKSEAAFKLRKGMPVAVLVTLRKKRLQNFIQKLVTYALPRMKDFYGLKKNNFDNYGNINLGIKEITIFPEAVSDKIKYNFGFEINLIASKKKKEENLNMWRELGFPIKL